VDQDPCSGCMGSRRGPRDMTSKGSDRLVILSSRGFAGSSLPVVRVQWADVARESWLFGAADGKGLQAFSLSFHSVE
jgi:hypothetical protein